jgi:hypothetical protein
VRTSKEYCVWTAWFWTRRHNDPSKSRLRFTSGHGLKPQKTWMFVVGTVRKMASCLSVTVHIPHCISITYTEISRRYLLCISAHRIRFNTGAELS